jgi:hypothetical protein
MNAKRGPGRQRELSESCSGVALLLEHAFAQFSLADSFMAAAVTAEAHSASPLAVSALAAERLTPAEWFLALVRLVPAAEPERSFARAVE